MDGGGGHALADAVVVEDGHGIDLATLQLADGAVVIHGAAAQQPVLAVHQGSGERGHVRLAAPRHQRRVGLAVQSGVHVVRRTRGW